MPQYGALGWARLCEKTGEKGDWHFACSPFTWEEPPRLNTLIKVIEPNGREWVEYIFIHLLGQSSTRLLVVLEGLSQEINAEGSASSLYNMLDELAAAAYDAGHNGVVPPANT